MPRVPQAPALTVLCEQVTAQSTPELLGSLLTTGLNWIPAAFPTATDVTLGGGVRAIETPGTDWLEALLPLLPHAARKQIATSRRNMEIRRLATTANLRPKNVNVINGMA